MKKLFLIPLLACFSCVMAWGTDAHVSTIADLNAKLADASVETIYLDADLTYTTEACINILRSVTIDGQDHKISGGGIRTGSTKSTMAINQGAPGNENWIDLVTLKNITLQNSISAGQALNVRCNLTKLVIENCTIKTTGSGNNQPITFGGNQDTPVDVTINDSYISSGQAGYPLITFNPIALTTKNTTYKGYCALYFKGPNSSAGTGGSTVDADNCDFDAPNMNAPAGGWNSFGVFAIEDGGITFNLNNCGFNSQEIGSDQQQVFLFSSAVSQISSLDPCVVRITGDNSHINGHMLRDAQSSIRAWLKENYDPNSWDHVIEITGGTYAEDPSLVTSGDLSITIPAEYEVKEIAYQDAETTTTLYRVVKKAQEKTPGVMYDLNDYVPVEGEGYGDNPVSSFDLSTGTDMTLNNEVTTAGYVQVSDNEDTGDATIVTVGQTAGGDDQTLIINNGLDVQGESQVIVESGATLQIGEGGINTEKPENIIIEANENGAASLLLDPTITVNQTPNLTVRMTAKQIGKLGGDYYWHRFAMPVDAGITSWEKEGALAPAVANNYPTYLYGWDYENNEWLKLTNGVADMTPLQGYTLTLASDEMPGVTGLQDVTYIFKGNLVGNTDKALNFQAEGFNFFGNSYTGYMDVLTLIQGIESNNVEGTVYMWCNDPTDDEGRYQSYEGVSLLSLQNPTLRLFLADWQKEVAPMQTFILRLRGADSANEEVSYASTIWGNPRYGNNSAPVPAPRRAAAANSIDSHMAIVVKAANSKGSRVELTQDVDHSDAFESGYDVVKYMNENAINLYATVDGEDLSTVVTNAIEGKTLSLKTNDEIAYTMSFKNVIGNEYAIRDNVTGTVTAITEGNIYEFAAQPNSLIEGRFEIVSRANAPTAIENTEVNANAKGIYTIMGQYLGENFDILPAGVYVVNGVKIVK